MIKLFTITIVCLILSGNCSAQSGLGGLKGFVASSIKNGSAINKAIVVLTAIKNNSNTKSTDTVLTINGYYKFEVSFGYYQLTILAKGYKTYITTVFIPSSTWLEWGTLLIK